MQKSLVIVASFMVLSACQGALDGDELELNPSPEEAQFDEVRTKQQELTMLSGSTWGRSEVGSTWDGTISVCWNSPGNSSTKNMIRDRIEDQWGETGVISHIQFTGWGDCGSAGANIPITFDCTPTNNTGCHDDYSGYVVGIGSNIWSMHLDLGTIKNGFWFGLSNNSIRETALHEFGHALGFTHEHHRVDTPPSCTAEQQGTSGDLFLTPFDIGAMVSYCHPNGTTNLINISPWDRDGLRRAYGFPNKWTQTSSWCGLGGAVYIGDFNGDGRDDQLCFKAGQRWIRFSQNSGNYSGAPTHTGSNWCTGSNAKLLVGDFDGNGRDDLLCQNTVTKNIWVDSLHNGLSGTDYSRLGNPWCTGSGNLLVGDHNGDGRDDLLCHSNSSGKTFVNHSSGSLNTLFDSGTNFQTSTTWCTGTMRMYYGDFDGDDKADRLCLKANGYWYVDRGSNGWNNSDVWPYRSGNIGAFCSPGQLRIGDFNGDGRDDMLCHDRADSNAQIAIQFSNSYAQFLDENWFGPMNHFCSDNSSDSVLHIGYFNDDSQADLLCHTRWSGTHAIEYPTTFQSISQIGAITLARPVWQSQDL